ncbi:MAG: succinate dehydrogenase cytochrome b subunit [Fulvivirga sp.]|uniref:succinate dehydrogenase cytochrome b subunit n=1 Tax=Fulvivirga sp. TaxID=1931237 RepID=UPI0032EF586A
MNIFFRKSILAASGLFLCIFLVVHLSANCILLLPEDLSRSMYNTYSTTLRESPLIKIIAYVLYLSIVLHIVYAAIITYHNRKAKPTAYLVNNSSENSSWSSQNMGFLGILVLIFLVVHLGNFWARIKLGIGEKVATDDLGNLDVYDVTVQLFQNPYYVIFYSVLAIPLGFHLHHGFKSAFKSLGFYHQSGLKILAQVSLIYAILMSLGFGIIPIIVFLK